jgi:hypothetical protein
MRCPGSGKSDRMNFQRKSKKRRVTDLVATYLKFKAIAKTGKAAHKTLKATGAYKAVKNAPKGVKALPVVAGVGAAGAAGAVALRRRSQPETTI